MAAHTAQRMRSKVTAEAILQHLHRAWMYARLMIVCLDTKKMFWFFSRPENKLERESAVFKQGILRNQNLPQNLYNLAGTAILLLTLPKHCVRQSLSFGSPFCECELKKFTAFGLKGFEGKKI